MPPKIDPTEIRYSTSCHIQSTSKSSEDSQDLLPPWLPNSVLLASYFYNYLRTLRKLVKISSRKVPNGRESELWFSWSAKIEQLKSISNQAHLLYWSKSSETMKEIERKLRTSTTKEISLSSKSRKWRKLSKKSQWPKTFQGPWSKFWEHVFHWDALWINKALSKLLPKLTTEKLSVDYHLFKLYESTHFLEQFIFL